MPSPEAAQYVDQADGRLKRITLILTNRCNFNCEYCISRPRPGTHKDLPTEDAMAALDFAKGKGIKIRCTGGEPSLHKDFFKIVQHAVDSGIPVEILTNGTFIPTNPREFEERMRPFLGQRRRWPRKPFKLANVQFQISVDPVHFTMDPNLKDRLFLLANFLSRHSSWIRYPSDMLKINVRGDFHDKVREILQTTEGLHPETVEALGGHRKLQEWLKKKPLHYYFEIQRPQSIIKVGGARDYSPRLNEMTQRGKIREFDIHKEMIANYQGTDISINPNGNAFASVYSAYENMFPTSRTPTGRPHPRPFRFGLLGNIHEHGIPAVVGTLMQRVIRWNEFLGSRYNKAGDPFFSRYYTTDLKEPEKRQNMRRQYAKFLDARRKTQARRTRK
jgi:hypothetical protein